jgi:hypothetical protein
MAIAVSTESTESTGTGTAIAARNHHALRHATSASVMRHFCNTHPPDKTAQADSSST